MTIYTWPTNDSAFLAARVTLRQRHNSRFNTSEISGAGQGNSLPGARWGLTIDLPRQTYAERARVEGFFNRLSGVEHRVQIWDLARPSPLGLSGSPLVNGAVAQFAQTLNLDGVVKAADNLLRGSQDFSSTYWPGGGASRTANTTTAPDGTNTADTISQVAAGQVATQTVTGAVAGGYTYSLFLKANVPGAVGARMLVFNATTSTTIAYIHVNTSTGAIAGTSGSPAISPVADVSPGGGWTRASFSVNSGYSAGDSLTCYIYPDPTTAAASVYAWGAMLTPGMVLLPYTGLPTLTAGDWLSLPLTGGGNQVVQVANTVAGETLTGVEFRPMLRAAVADNAAIGILQPGALYRLADPNALEFPRGGSGICPEMSIELIEEFA